MADTLERVNINTSKACEALHFTVESQRFGIREMVFDSGASLNVIDAELAAREYAQYIETTKGFRVRTGNGPIILDQVIRTQVKHSSKKPFDVEFYVLRACPYPFLVSRGLLRALGGDVLDPEGNSMFKMEAKADDLTPDLYEDFYKQAEYPLMAMQAVRDSQQRQNRKEFIDYYNEEWTRVHTRFTHHVKDLCIADTIVSDYHEEGHEINAIQVQNHRTPNQTELPNIEEEDETKDTPRTLEQITGEIQDPQIKEIFQALTRKYAELYAKNAADCGLIPDEVFKIKLIDEQRQPYSCKPYAHSYKQADEILRQTLQLEKQGFITRST